MIDPAAPLRSSIELLDTHPAVDVQEEEYARLLGYPREHTPSERARELAAWARRWYAEHGRPWVYLREAELQLTPDTLQLDGVEIASKQLHQHLLQANARRAILVAVGAGRSCEEHARQLWQESKPDEYFFLEIFGSAVVERLTATLSGRICDLADRDGLIALPHYSPGYTGWDIADQHKLFELITRGLTHPLPESLEVLPSGMLKPKKSLLAVVGLAPRTGDALELARRVPCESCGLSPCRFRRAPYRHAVREQANGNAAAAALNRSASYSVSARALAKWAEERVRLAVRPDGSVEATFRFDGTTCSNMGRPLAFDYRVELSDADQRYTILTATCAPAPDDEGHTAMCAYLSDGEKLMQQIAAPPPVVGQPLDAVLNWQREPAPSGCYCTAASRTHKWGLALEAIHFALARSLQSAAARADS